MAESNQDQSFMSQTIEELTKKNLAVAFKRLKKDTKGFKTLIVRDPLDYIDFIVNLDANLDSIIYEIKKSLPSTKAISPTIR